MRHLTWKIWIGLQKTAPAFKVKQHASSNKHEISSHVVKCGNTSWKKTIIIMDTIYNIFKKDLQRNFEES